MNAKKAKELRKMFPDENMYKTTKKYYKKLKAGEQAEFWETLKKISRSMAAKDAKGNKV